MSANTQNLQKLVWLWKCRAEIAANAHYFASDTYKMRHYIWSSLNISFAIFTLFFASSSVLSDLNLKIGDSMITWDSSIVGIMSAAVVATSAAQYIFDYRHVSNGHKFSANEYSNIKRKMERLLSSNEIDANLVHRLSSTLNWIAKSSPHLKRSMWIKSKTSHSNNEPDMPDAIKEFKKSFDY